ncbi:putative ribonuclease H-like domain-containing protein, partial [Tanacetum coccineum]
LCGEDPDFPDRVYKVEKALYGLHQAPRAWYETLLTYLLDNEFQRGKIDKTLFIKRHKGDILLVQVYVDDIIFGLTKKELCNAFEKLMHEKFQMSSMGELTFFLKFRFTKVKTASTPMETQKPLLKDEDGEEVDVHMYRLISWQYKKQTVVANSTTEAEYVAASSCYGQVLWIQNQLLDYGYNFMHTKIFIDNNRKVKKSVKLMMEKLFRMELELMLFWSTVKVKTNNGEAQLHALVDGKKIIITESTFRRDLQLEDEEGVDCLPNSTIFEQLTLMGFVQVFLEKQLEGMSNHKRIYVTPSHTKKIFGNMRRVGKGFSRRETPLFQTMMVQAQEEMGNVARNGVYEEMDDTFGLAGTTATSLDDPSENVAYETVHKELGDSLVRAATTAGQWVESSRYEESLGEDASKQGRINAINANEGITLVNDQDDVDMFDVNTLTGDEPSVLVSVVSASTKVSDAITTTATILTLRKGIVITELEEPEKPLKKKVQIMLDEKEDKRLQAEFDEGERLAREKDEANIVLTEEWDDIQAKIKQRRKHFAAKRAEEKRNKPPTQAQQRKIMCTYLKNMEGKKPKYLKNKSFDSIQKMFDRAFKRVNTFVNFITDLVEAEVDDVQETSKVDDDQEVAKIKELMEIVPGEEEPLLTGRIIKKERETITR